LILSDSQAALKIVAKAHPDAAQGLLRHMLNAAVQDMRESRATRLWTP
jgi:hypothetical protein